MGAEQAQFTVRGADLHHVAVLNRHHDLAVDGETNLIVGVAALSVDANGDLAVTGDNNGTHGEVGRTDGREDKTVDAGVDDGATGGE